VLRFLGQFLVDIDGYNRVNFIFKLVLTCSFFDNVVEDVGCNVSAIFLLELEACTIFITFLLFLLLFILHNLFFFFFLFAIFRDAGGLGFAVRLIFVENIVIGDVAAAVKVGSHGLIDKSIVIITPNSWLLGVIVRNFNNIYIVGVGILIAGIVISIVKGIHHQL